MNINSEQFNNGIDRIRTALQYIDSNDREKWLRIGMAIKSELGERGFELWIEWSQQSALFNEKDAKSVWKSIKHNGGVKIATLYFEAQKGGFNDVGYRKINPNENIWERNQIVNEPDLNHDAEIEIERAITAAKAEEIWSAAKEAMADNPYLSIKQVPSVPTLREIEARSAATILGYSPNSSGEPLTGRLLVVPVKQGSKLSTLELIDGNKRKTALAGRGTKSGGYWTAENLPDGNGENLNLLIGEGVATVMSAKVATGYNGIAALSSSNLLAIAKLMRERYPEANLVILADLIKSSGIPDFHATEAARLIEGKVAIPDFGKDRPTEMTDFNDMAIFSGMNQVKITIENASQPIKKLHQPAATVNESNGWPEPHPLVAKIQSEPFPLDALPDNLRKAVEEVAGFVKAPLPLVVSSALAALSLACQAHMDAKRAEKLEGPIGLFLLTIADSGERKSTCDGFFIEAIRQYEDEKTELMKPKIDVYQAAISAWVAERDGILNAIKSASAKSKSTNELKKELAELEKEKPEPPRVPRMLLTDETPENLAWGLAKNWPSAGVISSEAGVVLGSHGMGKDSVMRNLGLLNTLWDGGTISIGRKTSESFTVRGARLTIALQIQEATLKSFFDKSGVLARGTGFLARFLIAWPDSTQGYRLFTEPPLNWPHLASFNRRIIQILEQPVPISEDGVLSPTVISLSTEAKMAWVQYHDTLEIELMKGGELYDVRDVASKSADNAVRLAVLFQQFEHGKSGAVELEYFERASRIAAWYLNESRRFFEELAQSVEVADLVRLNNWLIEKCVREKTDIVSSREMQRNGPIRDKKRFHIALEELLEIDYIKKIKEGKEKNIILNPALIKLAP